MDVVSGYWFKHADFPNLGDEITNSILSRKFGVGMERESYWRARLVSTGSVLGWALNPPDVERPVTQHIVGSGFMKPVNEITVKEKIHVHSVRGFLSKQQLTWLDQGAITLGDPGLLASEIAIFENVPALHRVGLVPHYTNAENDTFLESYDHLSPLVMDIRTSDIDKFLSHLSACDIVISQSLHGLIFADSLGIPSVWRRLGAGEGGKDFKFHDYFSSVGRPSWKATDTAPRNYHELSQMASVADSARVSSLQSDILLAYEGALTEIAAELVEDGD